MREAYNNFRVPSASVLMGIWLGADNPSTCLAGVSQMLLYEQAVQHLRTSMMIWRISTERMICW